MKTEYTKKKSKVLFESVVTSEGNHGSIKEFDL